MSLFTELKRRNVFRVGAAYAAISWLVIQIAETTFPAFGLGDAALRVVIVVLAVGFFPTLIFAWAFELTPEGLKRDSEVDRTSPGTRRMTRRLDRLIMVALAGRTGTGARVFRIRQVRPLSAAPGRGNRIGHRRGSSGGTDRGDHRCLRRQVHRRPALHGPVPGGRPAVFFRRYLRRAVESSRKGPGPAGHFPVVVLCASRPGPERPRDRQEAQRVLRA